MYYYNVYTIYLSNSKIGDINSFFICVIYAIYIGTNVQLNNNF